MEESNWNDLFMSIEDKSVGDIVGTEEWDSRFREAVEKEFWSQFHIGKCKFPSLCKIALDETEGSCYNVRKGGNDTDGSQMHSQEGIVL